MAKFDQKVEQLRHELDDIIKYLQKIGRSDHKIKKVRNQLDNIDPFVIIDSAIAAETIIHRNKLVNLH